MTAPRPTRTLFGNCTALLAFLLAGSCAPRPVPPPASLPAPEKEKAAPAPSDRGKKPESPPTKAAPHGDEAAEAGFWKGRKDLIAAPEPRPAAPLSTAGLEKARLPSGLRVLLLADPTLKLVDVQLVVLAGGIDEPKGKAGLAEFTTSMLRHGTQKMSADALSTRLDSAGATLYVASDYETTTLACSGRASVLDLCLEVLAEIALRPTFPEEEMGEIRDRLLGSVKQIRDDPGALAELHFQNLLYGDDRPAGQPTTTESIGRIARGDLVSFHKRRFLPGSALLGLSGSIDPRTAKEKVKRAFGAWKGGAAAKREVKPVEPPPPGLRVLLVDKPDLSQSYFTLGHAGIRRTDPAKEAVSVMNYVLGGGGFSSRLMKVVRSEKGKTYGISSQFEVATLDGSFEVSSFTRNAELLSTVQLARREMTRFASDAPPSAAEIGAAKGKIAGGYVIRYQTTSRILGSLLHAGIFGLPDSEVTEYPVRVEKLTPEEIAKAAKEHLHPEGLVVAVVGRAKEVAEQLRAAKIPFEGPIGYLDPISAEERAAKKKGPK
jgi:zinc protease